MRRSLAIVVAAALAAVGASSASAKPEAVAGSQLNVYAAASLTAVFPTIDKKAKYNFAGSNQLAAQIRQGAPADVFAAASTKDPLRSSPRGSSRSRSCLRTTSSW